MGIYLNPGNEAYREATNSDIYVDKTLMISKINRLLSTNNKYMAISRPRRFGKSMAANMLAAYYGKECDSTELFAPYKISHDEDFKKYLNQYNVIKINMQEFLSNNDGIEAMLEDLEYELLDELRYAYGNILSDRDAKLNRVLDKIYARTKEKFIIIIDEWDCLLRERKNDEEAQKKYLDFLRNLLKDKVYVALAYMTGILPIKKYGTHSALNMFDEYSMLRPGIFAQFVGFTESEVEDCCKKYDKDISMMKKWYDGYYFPEVGHIYNPKSVVSTVMNDCFASYWIETETYEALKIYLEMNFDGLKDDIITMMGGKEVFVETRFFQNDMTTFKTKNDVLTLLVHLGYLVYNSENSSVSIPNYEIYQEFQNSIEAAGWIEVVKALKSSQKLLEDTWNMDEAAVAECIDETHSEFTSILKYNDENSLTCVLAIAYYKAIDYYTRVLELPTGKGYADIAFIPKKNVDKPAMIIELKYDKSAKTAIDQIKDKNYPVGLKDYQGNMLLVGINYDKESKEHSCKIEKW